MAGKQIRNMEHAMQHETLDLKEEKKYLHEMRQLKQLREQLSSNMGRQDDVQQALDQKDQIEERMKVVFSGCYHYLLISMQLAGDMSYAHFKFFILIFLFVIYKQVL